MAEPAPKFSVFPGGQPGAGVPGREYEELWFRIARMRWASVVLVPADSGTSAAGMATSLADVGSRLRETPVTAIVAESIDYGAARALADLQPRINGGAWPTVEVAATPITGAAGAAARTSPPPPHEAKLMPPLGRAIIAIQPVIEAPLGIAIAQAADAVVLCVELGVTRVKSARRTVDLIGAERIIGALLIR